LSAIQKMMLFLCLIIYFIISQAQHIFLNDITPDINKNKIDDSISDL
jgi:hypothetical protein